MTSTCPLGTKLVVTANADGRVEACATENIGISAIPIPGRTAEGVAASRVPTGMPGGIEGPYTSWYPDGSLRSHGAYRDLGSHSVPDGLWAFWDQGGRRDALGAFFRGEPVGCFKTWDEAGVARTGHVTGESFRADGCVAPSDEFLASVEARGPMAPPPPPSMSVMLGVDSGVGGMGARSPDQAESNPRLVGGIRAGWRKERGAWSVGPVLGFKTSIADYSAYLAGVALGRELVRWSPRIATEGTIEVGAQYTRVTARPRGYVSVATLGFWSPLPAAQLATSIGLTRNVSAVVGLRVEGTPWRDVHRDVVYCGGGCNAPLPETWRVGGFAGELVAALRLTMR